MPLRIFLTCICMGAASGIVYDALFFVRLFCGGREDGVRRRIVTACCDIAYFLVFAAAFVFVSVRLSFFGLRLYMLAGCALGITFYVKSLHIIIAFFIKKAYNIIAEKADSRKKAIKRREKHER